MSYALGISERLKEEYWFIDWKISAFPKSYLLNRGLNPCKRLKNCYVYSNTDNLQTQQEVDTYQKEDLDDEPGDTKELQSEITAVKFYEDNVIFYDDGEFLIKETVCLHNGVKIK